MPSWYRQNPAVVDATRHRRHFPSPGGCFPSPRTGDFLDKLWSIHDLAAMMFEPQGPKGLAERGRQVLVNAGRGQKRDATGAWTANAKDVQTALIRLGFLPALAANGKSNADGVMGTNTIGAIVRFQQKNKLQVTGYVDAATWGLLNAQSATAAVFPGQGAPKDGILSTLLDYRAKAKEAAASAYGSLQSPWAIIAAPWTSPASSTASSAPAALQVSTPSSWGGGGGESGSSAWHPILPPYRLTKGARYFARLELSTAERLMATANIIAGTLRDAGFTDVQVYMKSAPATAPGGVAGQPGVFADGKWSKDDQVVSLPSQVKQAWMFGDVTPIASFPGASAIVTPATSVPTASPGDATPSWLDAHVPPGGWKPWIAGAGALMVFSLLFGGSSTSAAGSSFVPSNGWRRVR